MKYKIKSHSGVKKRFKITSSGKVKYKKAGLRHLLTGMSSDRARRLRKMAVLSKSSSEAIKKQLPYG
jgi:large subunit ribosomal protein L35